MPELSSKALSQSQMENEALAAVLQLAEVTGALTLEEVLEYRVTDESFFVQRWWLYEEYFQS